jgi:hypothetical protein
VKFRSKKGRKSETRDSTYTTEIHKTKKKEGEKKQKERKKGGNLYHAENCKK